MEIEDLNTALKRIKENPGSYEFVGEENEHGYEDRTRLTRTIQLDDGAKVHFELAGYDAIEKDGDIADWSFNVGTEANIRYEKDGEEISVEQSKLDELRIGGNGGYFNIRIDWDALPEEYKLGQKWDDEVEV